MTHFLSYLFQSVLKMQLILRGGQTFTSKCFGMKSFATGLPIDMREMVLKESVAFGERDLQRGGSQRQRKKGRVPEQRLNPSENPPCRSPGGQPCGRKFIVLQSAQSILGIRNVCRGGRQREVPEHLQHRLPGSSARGRGLSPLRVESFSISTTGIVQGLSPTQQFLQDAYTSSSLKSREVTNGPMCQYFQQLRKAFPLL